MVSPERVGTNRVPLRPFFRDDVWSGSPANEALSGQMPVSITPTTTPRPASSGPPSFDQTPSEPDSPRKSTDFLSSGTLRSVFRCTDTTPSVRASVAACAPVISAVNAFTPTSYRSSGVDPIRAATVSWRLRRYDR